MSTSPPPPPKRKPISLAKLGTIFAVAFIVAFGLCTVSANNSIAVSGKVAGFFIGTSLVIEAICAIGLVVVGLMAFIRSAQN